MVIKIKIKWKGHTKIFEGCNWIRVDYYLWNVQIVYIEYYINIKTMI